MFTESMLKQKLRPLAGKDFQLTAADDLDALLEAMLVHIGSLDPELRDELIYSAFAAWIIEQNALNPQQMRRLLNHVLDEDHLFHGIGEQGTDSVFTRAFSVLLLPLLLIAHRRQPYLTPAEVNRVQASMLRFFHQEHDRRGFVQDKGWAHAVAHAADALDDLAQCAEVQADGLREMLAAVQTAICIQDEVYTHGEEERLTTAMLAIVGRQLLPEDELLAWVEGLAEAALTVTAMPHKLLIRSNVKNFLQSLYFRLYWAQTAPGLQAAILRTLRRINPYAGRENE